MQITPSIHQLTLPFIVPSPAGAIPRTVNLFLLPGEEITLIDSGVRGAEGSLADYLLTIGRPEATIRQLLLTHAHPDHIGAAMALRRRYNCRVACHPHERGWVEDVACQERERPVPGFQELVGGSVPIDFELVDGGRVELGGERFLTVLHTPGHSPGSITFWSEEERVLFCGDAVPLAGEMPIFSDYAASLKSLQRLQSYEPDWLLSAWDEPQRGDAARQRIDDALAWLARIKATVQNVVRPSSAAAPLELCREVIPLLGLPHFAVNPLVARSLLACL